MSEAIRTNWRDYTYPTTAVIERVAAATNRKETSLPSLHESIDTDALDTLLTGDEKGDSPVEVTFSYLGLSVTVRSDRTMVLHPEQ